MNWSCFVTYLHCVVIIKVLADISESLLSLYRLSLPHLYIRSHHNNRDVTTSDLLLISGLSVFDISRL